MSNNKQSLKLSLTGIDYKIHLIVSTLGPERIKVGVDVSEYLATGLGSKSAGFYIATTIRELVNAVRVCRELKVPYLIIGTGSKVALSKDGFLGMVIKNRSDNLKVAGVKGKVSRGGIGIEEALIEADSGVSLRRLAEFGDSQKLTGFEGLQVSPGTIGGSLLINDLLISKCHQVEIMDRKGEVKKKNIGELKSEEVILTVIFKLKSKDL